MKLPVKGVVRGAIALLCIGGAIVVSIFAARRIADRHVGPRVAQEVAPAARRAVPEPGPRDLDPEPNSERDWFVFNPPADNLDARSPIALRHLNEGRAGEHGFIATRAGHFVRGPAHEPIRFWAVNGPESSQPDDLAAEARQLAKHGVNLARLYVDMPDARGEPNLASVQTTLATVDALANQGIYSHLWIYFPVRFHPPADLAWLRGYDGKRASFAALYFNPEFQERYHAWWRALLLTESPRTHRRLVDEPALFGAELVNEDSLLFWTFNPDSLPAPELARAEQQFAAWLQGRYGSLAAAVARWGAPPLPHDDLGAGRVGFRALFDIASARTLRDQDTVRFLVEVQRRFYEQQVRFLRGLGFRGLVTASNWQTASPERLGPLEKYSYTVGDFLDRHGYFGCRNRGEGAEWSLRDGHSYVDRSALRFEAEEPGKPALFVNPVMDVHYDDHPSMISEVGWNRPNRHRSEAPLYLAAYGALQGTDAIVHYSKDGLAWRVKPNFFMQPWSLTSPAMLAQFPAAALIFREGLVHTGAPVVDLTLGIDQLFALAGTPLPEDAALDELRLKDIPSGAIGEAGGLIDPLVHYVGPTHVRFSEGAIAARAAGPAGEVAKLIDRGGRRVTSVTSELTLDYGRGVLTIAAPAAQGASGDLAAAGGIELPALRLSSPLEVAHIIVVSLDGRPLLTSGRMLLQVMSEEKNSGFRRERLGPREFRITSIGQEPWLVRRIAGRLALKRQDAAKLRVLALDGAGMPTGRTQSGDAITLEPTTLYYLIRD